MNFLKKTVVFLIVCYAGIIIAQTKQTFSISINPVFNGEKLALETKQYISPVGDTLVIERFRFYLSSFELVFKDGTIYKEKNSYHLVDAEEPKTLLLILKDVPKGEISLMKFNIGVDSIKSVSGVMDGDLDPRHGMYWAWNSGYINAKLEGKSRSCKAHQNRFEFHIGGYAFPENSLRKVELDLTKNKSGNFKGNNVSLTADIQTWFKDVSLAAVSGIMIPGEQAMKMADNYSKMFGLLHHETH